jgi:hypothetical protein
MRWVTDDASSESPTAMMRRRDQVLGSCAFEQEAGCARAWGAEDVVVLLARPQRTIPIQFNKTQWPMSHKRPVHVPGARRIVHADDSHPANSMDLATVCRYTIVTCRGSAERPSPCTQ